MTELLPAAGVAGVLAAVILYLLNANRNDRIEHRKERGEWDLRFRELHAEHAAELDKQRARLDALEEAKRSETQRADREARRADLAEDKLRGLAS